MSDDAAPAAHVEDVNVGEEVPQKKGKQGKYRRDKRKLFAVVVVFFSLIIIHFLPPWRLTSKGTLVSNPIPVLCYTDSRQQ